MDNHQLEIIINCIKHYVACDIDCSARICDDIMNYIDNDMIIEQVLILSLTNSFKTKDINLLVKQRGNDIKDKIGQSDSEDKIISREFIDEVKYMYPYVSHYISIFGLKPAHYYSCEEVRTIQRTSIEREIKGHKILLEYTLCKGTILYHASPILITNFNRLAFFAINPNVAKIILTCNGRYFSCTSSQPKFQKCYLYTLRVKEDLTLLYNPNMGVGKTYQEYSPFATVSDSKLGLESYGNTSGLESYGNTSGLESYGNTSGLESLSDFAARGTHDGFFSWRDCAPIPSVFNDHVIGNEVVEDDEEILEDDEEIYRDRYEDYNHEVSGKYGKNRAMKMNKININSSELKNKKIKTTSMAAVELRSEDKKNNNIKIDFGSKINCTEPKVNISKINSTILELSKVDRGDGGGIVKFVNKYLKIPFHKRCDPVYTPEIVLCHPMIYLDTVSRKVLDGREEIANLCDRAIFI